jgi:hypothetical protein
MAPLASPSSTKRPRSRLVWKRGSSPAWIIGPTRSPHLGAGRRRSGRLPSLDAQHGFRTRGGFQLGEGDERDFVQQGPVGVDRVFRGVHARRPRATTAPARTVERARPRYRSRRPPPILRGWRSDRASRPASGSRHPRSLDWRRRDSRRRRTAAWRRQECVTSRTQRFRRHPSRGYGRPSGPFRARPGGRQPEQSLTRHGLTTKGARSVS